MFEIAATALPRMMACNGSRLLGGQKPPNGDDTTMRDEGIAAHWVIAQIFHKRATLADLVNTKAPNGVTITNGIAACIAPFLNSIAQNGESAVWQNVEFDASFGNEFFRVACRPDHAAFNGSTLWVDDFKHGFRIVEPLDNWTLLAYAIGICRAKLWQPANIVISVHQPRVPHPQGTTREWVINFATLMQKYDLICKTLMFPRDDLNTGPHCDKCNNVTVCPAARIASFNSVDVSFNAYSEEISDIDLAVELDVTTAAEKRLKERKKQLEDLALHRLKNSRIIPGYAVERSVSNRKWNDGLSPEFLCMITGKNVTKTEMITPAQAVASGISEIVVNQFSSRAETGLKLSRVSAQKHAERIFGRK